MKILQIAPQFPFPMTDGGKISIAQNTRHFSRLGAEVCLFSVVKKQPSELELEQARQYVVECHICEARTENSLTNIAKSLITTLPLYVEKLNASHLKKEICHIARAFQPDVIHAEHSNTIPLALAALQEAPKAIFGLRLHNIEWLIWARYAERFSQLDPRHYYAHWQAEKLRRYEQEHYPKATICFPISNAELLRAQQLAPNARYKTAVAGVDTEQWQPTNNHVEKVEGRMILATTFTWTHNIEAVEWLLREVMPLVQQKIPKAHLLLLGKNPPSHFADYQSCQVMGFVPDAVPLLQSAQVYVAPLFVGGGIRIKILEALAMELPVVATSIAAEGIEASEEQGIFRADNAVHFAEKIINLLLNNKLALSSGKQGRNFVKNFHRWEQCATAMIQIYQELLNDNAGTETT